jgi:hypothetical protein
VGSAVVVSVANAGGYFGPKLFALAYESEQNYWPAMIAMGLFQLTGCALLVVLKRRNPSHPGLCADPTAQAAAASAAVASNVPLVQPHATAAAITSDSTAPIGSAAWAAQPPITASSLHAGLASAGAESADEDLALR